MRSWAASEVKRTWRGLGRKLRRWAYVAGFLAFVTGDLRVRLGSFADVESATQQMILLFAFAALYLSVLLALTALPAGWLLRFWRRHSWLHSLEWDPLTETIRLRGDTRTLAISSAEILSAHFIPSEGTLVLHQKGGRELLLSMTSSNARDFLRASKLGPRHRATRITSASFLSPFVGCLGMVFLLPATFLGLLSLSGLWLHVTPAIQSAIGPGVGSNLLTALILPVIVLTIGDILIDLTKVVTGSTLVLGTDGIRWGKLRRKFIAYAGIASLRVLRFDDGSSDHLIIEAKDGVTEHKIPIHCFVKDASDIVEERLRGALEQSADILMPQLDRQGRSDEEWREALRELVKHRGDYRKAAVPKERVRALLQDPAAPPEQRLGAAVALVEAEDPEARRILVSISENIADPELRDAIDSLVDEAEEFEVEEVAIQAETGHSVSP